VKFPIAAIIGIAVLVLIILLLNTYVKVRLLYRRENEHDHFVILIYIWGGLLKKEIAYPSADVKRIFPVPLFTIVKKVRSKWRGIAYGGRDSNGPNIGNGIADSDQLRVNKKEAITEERFGVGDILDFASGWRKKLKKYRRTYNYIKDRVRLERFIWHTFIGFDDAAETGIVAGAVWALKGIIMATFINNLKVTGPKDLRVITNFDRDILKTEIDCLISVWIGYVLVAGLKMLLKKRKEKRRAMVTKREMASAPE